MTCATLYCEQLAAGATVDAAKLLVTNDFQRPNAISSLLILIRYIRTCKFANCKEYLTMSEVTEIIDFSTLPKLI